MSANIFVNGEWLTTVKPADMTFYSSNKPFDFDRVLTVRADFPADVLEKMEKKPNYTIVFGGVARGSVESVDNGEITVRMKNSEFQKLRRREAE
ncbi:hypothetical protein [Peribacillus huizhouensis]|uniref:Uncharacterized protein n=1 Tax=Peribacillus huizhouensis TaxID=1501239 RepID=A0ABR6CR99_9BACI|nr:hypothetical protein [Peribacillus huizhouensis]MBA9027557.1 hypothetical protein [Peribacillus huizhouensis]